MKDRTNAGPHGGALPLGNLTIIGARPALPKPDHIRLRSNQYSDEFRYT